jgi:hypothetical protein
MAGKYSWDAVKSAMRASKSTQLTCAITALVALMLCLCGALAFPVRISCGQINYACATAPDPVTSEYRLYYEWEPLAVTMLETLVGENFQIYYSSGHDAVPVTP